MSRPCLFCSSLFEGLGQKRHPSQDPDIWMEDDGGWFILAQTASSHVHFIGSNQWANQLWPAAHARAANGLLHRKLFKWARVSRGHAAAAAAALAAQHPLSICTVTSWSRWRLTHIVYSDLCRCSGVVPSLTCCPSILRSHEAVEEADSANPAPGCLQSTSLRHSER